LTAEFPAQEKTKSTSLKIETLSRRVRVLCAKLVAAQDKWLDARTHLCSTLEMGACEAAREWASGLRLKNWANLVAYAINCIIVFTSLSGAFGETNSDLSAKYQTLLTPAGWAFSIWGPIFAMQGVFAVAQLSRRMRDTDLFQRGVGWWYCAVCAMQVAWTFAFAQQQLWLSTAFMYGILASLTGLLYNTGKLITKTTPPLEYWLLHAPFAIHAGWIVAAATVNVQVVVNDTGGATEQLACAVASLAAVAALNIGVLVRDQRATSPWINGVSAWALFAIAAELRAPSTALSVAAPGVAIPLITDAFARASTALAVSLASLAIAVVVEPWCRAAVVKGLGAGLTEERSVAATETANPV
jgi:hypothetical protein